MPLPTSNIERLLRSVMRFLSFFVSLAVVAIGGVASSSVAHAQTLLTYYNFSTVNGGGAQLATPINASSGTGQLTTNFVATNVLGNTGTTINAQNNDQATNAIQFQNGTNGVNNGRYFQLQFSTVGFDTLNFSTALFRSSADAPTSLVTSYSTDGTNFTVINGSDFGNQAVIGNYVRVALNLNNITALNNRPAAYLRFTSSGGNPTNSAGNLRLDNLLVTGEVATVTIPEENTFALIAFALPAIGALVSRRRK